MTVSATHTWAHACTHTRAHTHAHWGVQRRALGWKQNKKFMQQQLSTASCQERSDHSANTDISSNQCLVCPTGFVTSPSLGHYFVVTMQGRPQIFFQTQFYKTFLCKFYSKGNFKAILKITESTSPVFSGMENYSGCFSRGEKA